MASAAGGSKNAAAPAAGPAGTAAGSQAGSRTAGLMASNDSLHRPGGLKVQQRTQLVHCFPTSGLPAPRPAAAPAAGVPAAQLQQQPCKAPLPAQGCSMQQQQQHLLQLAVPRASGTHGSLRGSRRCTAAAQSDSASSCLPTPKQRPQQAEQQEADGSPLTAQLLPELEGSQHCCTRLERAAARKIAALPHVICQAADGELFEMSTRHVRQMVLTNELQQLGVVLTAREQALLLKEAPSRDNTCWPGTRLGMRSFSIMGDVLCTTGCGSTAAGSSVNGGEGGGGSQARAATHASLLPAPGVSRSAVGAALEAHAAAEPVAAQLHEALLDDELLERIARLDLAINSRRAQLAEAAAQQRAAAAAAADASTTSDDGMCGMQTLAHLHSASQPDELQAATQAHASLVSAGLHTLLPPSPTGRQQLEPGARGWSAASQAQSAGACDWQQQAGSYTACCAELHIMPCTKLLQQLACARVDLANCLLGSAGAVALAAALAASSGIEVLNLRDNGLEGKAVGAILAGIAASAAAPSVPRASRHSMVAFEQPAAAAVRPGSQCCNAGEGIGSPQAAPQLQQQDGMDNSLPAQHAAQPLRRRLSIRWAEQQQQPDGSSLGELAAAAERAPGAVHPDSSVAAACTAVPQDQVHSTLLPDAAALWPVSPTGAAASAVAAERAGGRGASIRGAHSRQPSSEAAAALDTAAASTGSRRRRTSSSRSSSGGLRCQRSLLCRQASSSSGGGGGGGSSATAGAAALRELDLGQNPLGLAGAQLVAHALQPTLQCLRSLGLAGCSIPEAGGLCLVAALAAGGLRLTRLSLARNALGDGSAAALGELLEGGAGGLRELDLSWNSIRAGGAGCLARGLAANASLSALALAHNGLGEAGGDLGRCLALNCGLSALDLSHCRLGPAAAAALAEGLQGNAVLQQLQLGGNALGAPGVERLRAVAAAAAVATPGRVPLRLQL